MYTETILASQCGAALDSDVYNGGGSDDTAVLQSVLDRAVRGGLRLIMDGAALVTGLTVHGNTTIECLNGDCGFFLAAGSNRPLLKNANHRYEGITDRNITLTGGTYNHNCAGQSHDVGEPDMAYRAYARGKKIAVFDTFFCCAFHFVGVENFLVRDVTIRNQRTFAALICNFRNAVFENIRIDLPDRMTAQNQDGLHFWGPGRFLTLRNICGSSGDDFLALAPDEHDGVSDITDVLVDGVHLDNADQVMRLLSRSEGRLDRVIIRNVTGTYRSFGFTVNPFFCDEYTRGNFGHITFENIDLQQADHVYKFSVPFLFRFGGNIERVTLRNIRHSNPTDVHTLIQIGGPFCGEASDDPRERANVGTIDIDGLEFAQNPNGMAAIGIEVKDSVENLMVSRAVLRNMNGGAFINILESGSVKNLMLGQIITNGTALLEGGNAGHIFESDITV